MVATAQDVWTAIKAFRVAADGDSNDVEHDAAVTLADEVASFLQGRAEALKAAEKFIEEELEVRRRSYLPDESPYIAEAKAVLDLIGAVL